MIWDLPKSVDIDGDQYEIERECDYRVILDILSIYEDETIESEDVKHKAALFVFYKEPKKIKDPAKALEKMLQIIEYTSDDEKKIYSEEMARRHGDERLMKWSTDFKYIAPAVSKVLGYDVRDPERYTHWWTFLGAYMEIPGESVYSTILSIRKKRKRGEKLEKWEREFYENNKSDIDIVLFSEEEIEWLQ